ncbi:MAG: hypothetical protein ONB06_06155, partial [candidate division KSB1 bacterium]|nr:hypothetical protein [candidate division KSB1 bacterium]
MNTQASERTNSRGFAAWLQKHPGAALVYFLVLPLMACLALILPPIALPTRIANAGFTPISKQGVILTDPDGMELVIPENGISKGGAVRLTSMPLDAFLTSELGSTLPPYLEAKGPLYRIEVQGEQPRQAELYVPIPLDSEPYETLDLYGLLNQRWFKLPFVLNAQDARLESQLNFLPEAAIVVQTLPRAPVISAQLLSKKGLPDIANDVLVQVNPVGLRLADEGSIAGEPVSAPQTNPASNLAVIPTVTNVDENGVRIDLTGNMMADEAQRTAHINALVDLAVQKIYRGYDIAYEGIGPGDEALYTQFIKELARALHARQKTLTITLPAPLPISEDQFDTAGYNWALLGRYADNVKIPLLSDPRAYEGEPSLQDQYLRWAVGQIDRSKIQLLAFTMARDSTADQFTPVPFGSALDLPGP